MITADTRQIIGAEIMEDMKLFLSEMKNEDIDMKSLGIRGRNKETMLELLSQCYGIE